MKRYSTTNQIVFDGYRGSGKTLQLIFYAINNDMTIVCQDPRYVTDMAHELNVSEFMRRPISYQSLLNNRDRGSSTKGYLIDDVEVLLNHICNGRCGGFSHSVRRMDLNFMYKNKRFKPLKKMKRLLSKIKERFLNG